MLRILKFISYLALFVFSFLLFLYWMFPYDVLRDRVATAIENPFGRSVEVIIGELEPYYFTGVSISDLKLVAHGEGEPRSVAELQKVRARASLFSLIFGNPHVSFLIRSGKGEVEGDAKQTEEGFDIDVEMDEFNLSNIRWLESTLGLRLTGKLDGDVALEVDKLRPVRTRGEIDLSLDDFKIAKSQLTIGEIIIPLPDMVLSKGKGSRLKVKIDKGTMNIEEFSLADGDLELNLKGKIFLSATVSNYRLNLKGYFKVSDKLKEAIPLLFMAENQKKDDGTYPLTLMGRLAAPSIRIGTFILPL